MSDLPRSHLLVYAIAGLVVVVFGLRQLRHPAPDGAAAAPVQFASHAGGGEHSGGAIVVNVAGAVRHPGVYRLHAGARVNDALRLAGGPRRHAAVSQINLAQKLEDGRQILVPVRTPAALAGVPVAPGAAPSAPINLNTATVEQLDTLTGVGPTTAQQIVTYRQAHGGFGSVDELDSVPGIGPATLAALRDLVTV